MIEIPTHTAQDQTSTDITVECKIQLWCFQTSLTSSARN